MQEFKEKELKQVLKTQQISKEGLKTEQVLKIEKKSPQSLKEYLKLELVKNKTTQDLKTIKLDHETSVEHKIVDEEVHIRNYCKMIKHILKLEYHHFDHDWFPNINMKSSSNLVNLTELSLNPDRVERILKEEHPKKLKHLHTRINLEH